MFRASEAAIRLLAQAQARAEEAYLAQGAPPLHLPSPAAGGEEAQADGPQPGER